MVRKSKKMDLKKNIPWWLKFCIKLILSLLPINYEYWRKLGIFKHGSMNKPSLAISTFQKYYKIANEHKKISIVFQNILGSY